MSAHTFAAFAALLAASVACGRWAFLGPGEFSPALGRLALGCSAALQLFAVALFAAGANRKG